MNLEFYGVKMKEALIFFMGGDEKRVTIGESISTYNQAIS